MPRYLTRISNNTNDWTKPSGIASKQEAKDTYNASFGFGHEDWLFRKEWQIDGWRYAFVEGVNKSHKRLVEEGESFDLVLYTIDSNKRRRYVAEINEVECLDDADAATAVEEFKQRGWYKTMEQEILAVDGDPGALGNAEYARHILNIRFRPDAVSFFEGGTFAKDGDPILKINRYQLVDLGDVERKRRGMSLPLLKL